MKFRSRGTGTGAYDVVVGQTVIGTVYREVHHGRYAGAHTIRWRALNPKGKDMGVSQGRRDVTRRLLK